MGWLQDITDWLREQIVAVWNAFAAFVKDMLVALVEVVLDLGATVIEAIPVPDFVSEYAISSLLSNIGSDLMWFMGALRVGEGIALLGLGYAFRLVRKALTLGQW